MVEDEQTKSKARRIAKNGRWQELDSKRRVDNQGSRSREGSRYVKMRGYLKRSYASSHLGRLRKLLVVFEFAGSTLHSHVSRGARTRRHSLPHGTLPSETC